MRHITQAGLELIKSFEGFKESIYLCPAGVATIGYGHVVKMDENFEQRISKQRANDLLRSDLSQAEQAVLRNINTPLSDGQFDALVSFTFNVGGAALQRSSLRQKVNCADHDLVPAELLRWIWAGGQKLVGLIRRRQAEACLYIG